MPRADWQPSLTNDVLVSTNYYDAKSRRVRKTTPESTHTYFYDGWNLIEERVAYSSGTTTTIRYYWGKDLSGTFQGAGGVGGLLYLIIDNDLYIPCYDSNGNITHYLDASGDIVASYTYDAFGNTISASGNLADTLRHRFSTKYFDPETSFYYYGYRFYLPTLMCWLNRDPLEETTINKDSLQQSLNVYSFLSNSSIFECDYLGLTSTKSNTQKWRCIGTSTEFHNYNCGEWMPNYGTTAMYFRHLKDITFRTEIKVPVNLSSKFATAVIKALEMDNDSTSYWCMTYAPLSVETCRQDNKTKYRIRMHMMNFDKHPECKGSPKRPEIHIPKFEKKWVTYEL